MGIRVVAAAILLAQGEFEFCGNESDFIVMLSLAVIGAALAC
jgi:hypothetical protein